MLIIHLHPDCPKYLEIGIMKAYESSIKCVQNNLANCTPKAEKTNQFIIHTHIHTIIDFQRIESNLNNLCSGYYNMIFSGMIFLCLMNFIYGLMNTFLGSTWQYSNKHSLQQKLLLVIFVVWSCHSLDISRGRLFIKNPELWSIHYCPD